MNHLHCKLDHNKTHSDVALQIEHYIQVLNMHSKTLQRQLTADLNTTETTDG